jgi:hypothetical protein
MNPIDYNDLVKNDAFGRLIKEGEQLIVIYEKLGATLKEAMLNQKSATSGGSPNTLKEAEEYQKLTDKIFGLEEQLKKTKKAKEQLTVETAKAKIEQQEYDKSIKETAKDELGLITAYQKESKTLNDLRKQYKDLVLTNQQNTKVGKEMLANVTALDTKLKHVDATVGQHQRNVGNYSSALSDMKTGLMQIGQSLGLAFGVHQVIDFGKETVKAFLEAEKNATDLKNALGGNTLAFDTMIKQSEELQDKSIFSDDDIQIAQKQLAIYGLTADQIEKLTPQIVDLASKTGDDLSSATEKAISAINGQTKGLKQAGITFKDAGSKTENFALLTEKLTKFQGASAEALETTIGKAKRLENAFDNIKESIGEYLVGAGADILDNFEVIFGGRSFDDLALQKNKEKVIKVMDEVNLETLKRAKESEANRLKAVEDTEKNIRALAKKGLAEKDETAQKLTASQIKNQQHLLSELQKMNDKQVIEDDATAGAKEKSTEDYGKKLRDLETQNIQLSYNRRRKEIQDNFDDESAKYEGHTEILKQLAIKRANALELVYRDEQREYDKIRNEADKNELKKMEVDDVAFSPKVKANQDAIIKKKEDDEIARKQEREDAMNHADDLYAIYKEANEKKNKLQLEAIDYSLQKNKSAIEIQLELASRGMDNTLAYEMKKQDELEKARVKELERQKKVAKQQEAIELSLAFIKAYEGYISNGTKSGEALLKASGDIFTAKLLSKAISGSAFEGVEDTGPGGTLDAQGGMLWKLHPHEGVANAKGNKKYKGAIGAINDGTLDSWAMDNIFKPQFNSGMELSDVSKAGQVSNALNIALLGEIRELKEVVKNKPENHSNIDNAGNVIKTMVRNGIKTITVKKTHLS